MSSSTFLSSGFGLRLRGLLPPLGLVRGELQALPKASAAARMSGATSWKFALLGFPSRAIALTSGRSSCSNSTSLDPRAVPKTLIPVRLLFGRFKLSTRPTLTGSTPTEDNGDRFGSRLCSKCRRDAKSNNYCYILADQFSRKRRQAILDSSLGGTFRDRQPRQLGTFLTQSRHSASDFSQRTKQRLEVNRVVLPQIRKATKPEYEVVRLRVL